MLTRPGLSVIVSAIIGARKIFQRMTTYSKYTVAMTFRICFTFGLLTVIYDWCGPHAGLISCTNRYHAPRYDATVAICAVEIQHLFICGCTGTSRPS